MEALLRTPFQGAPSSLLKGDDYFLPTLERAMQALAVDYDPVDAEHRPVHLGITTTLLTGGRKVTSDALGQTIPQALHAGVLTFRHLESRSDPDGAEGMDGADRDDSRLNTSTRPCAGSRSPRAARQAPHSPSNQLFSRSDRSRIQRPSRTTVQTSSPTPLGRPGQPVDQSRYGVDGGILVNTPTVAALRAIEGLPSRRSARRVMLLVFRTRPRTLPCRPQTSTDRRRSQTP